MNKFRKIALFHLVAYIAAMIGCSSVAHSQTTPTTCGPGATSSGDPCTVTTTQIDANTLQVRIDKPVVDRDHYDYTSLALQPGDHISITGGGCVQIGGGGASWKRYFNPSGDNSDHLYFGMVTIPGGFVGTTPVEGIRVSSVIGQTIIIPAGVSSSSVTLSYPDDQYDDNGYYRHDDGNDNQCAFSNDGGPAYVIITIQHGIAGPLPLVPAQDYDLVPHGFDPNNFFADPRWGWQLKSTGTTIPPYRAGNPDTSQITTFDKTHSRLWDIFGLCNGGDGGHRNWFDVQYTGTVTWDSWDNPLFGDDDYNVKLVTDPVGPFVAGATSDNTDHVKLEFDSDETIDHFDDIPFWSTLHALVKNGDPTTLINGHRAVTIGLMGIDEGHPDSHGSEIHPVHALAIRMFEPFDPADDGWAIWVRNSGDEGECSSAQHFINRTTIHLKLPRPTASDGVDASAIPSLFASNFVAHRATAPVRFFADASGAVLSFDIPAVNDDEGDDAGFYVGEIHMSWPATKSASPVAALRQSAAVAQPVSPEDPGEAESFLRDAFNALTPDQKVIYLNVENALAPQPLSQATSPVRVNITATPPASDPSVPTVSTRPAPRHVQRLLAVGGAFCAAYKGKWPGEPTGCTTFGPTTVLSSSGGAPGNAGWLVTPLIITLTAYDGNGSGIDHTEYSFDGANWITYTGPVVAPEGAISVFYRSKDRAGSLEETRSAGFRIDTRAPNTSATVVSANGGVKLTYSVTDPMPGSGPAGLHAIVQGATGPQSLFFASPSGSVALPTACSAVELWGEDIAGNQKSPHAKIADSVPPIFTSVPAAVTFQSCSAASGLTLALPVATDDCTAHPAIAGLVIATNGVANTPPIPILGNTVTLGPGTHTVRWTATDASGLTSSVTRTVTVQPGFMAGGSLSVADRATVISPSGEPGLVANSGTRNTVMGVEARTGDIMSVGPVKLGDRAFVGGAVLSAGAVTSGVGVTVTGGIHSNTTVGLPALPDLSHIVFPPSQVDALLGPGQSRAILPGSYRNVNVQSRATLRLVSGTYFFHNLESIEPQATVLLDESNGPIIIYVQTWGAFRGAFVDSSGDYSRFLIGYLGTAPLKLEAPFNGTFIAPQAQVTLGIDGSARYTGDFFAQGLALTPGTVVVCQSSLVQ